MLQAGGVRVRQHVNPLKRELQVRLWLAVVPLRATLGGATTGGVVPGRDPIC